MYHRYFGLNEAPFSIAVNPRYLFMSARHRDALAHLLYGVGVGGGFILLTGEVGTGKTTINRCLLEQLPDNTDIALILNPALNAVELLATVCDELGIGYDKGEQSLKVLTDKLHQFLLSNHAQGRNTVLLIDEAQHLQFDVLEQIRLLTNLETNTKKLLQIILVGQPELRTLLNQPELRQLAQRITARYQLKPLNFEETQAYIRHRLQISGLPANQELFPKKIIKGIHKTSRGVPRVINVLCDRMLLGAYGQNKMQVDRAIFKQAVIEVMGEEDDILLQPESLLKPWLVPTTLIVLLGLVTALWVKPIALLFTDQPVTEAIVTPASSASPTTPSINSQPAGSLTTTPKVEDNAEQLQSAFFESQQQAIDELLNIMALADVNSADICANTPTSSPRCEQFNVPSWQALLDYNRPAVLRLITPAKMQVYVTLLAIDNKQAILQRDNKTISLPLTTIGEMWTGDFLFIWQPSKLYTAPFAEGAQGPIVAWLAQQFAQLDQQPTLLADQTFNAALGQRVKLFQAQHQLQADGVVGLKTLLQLNQQLGLEPTLQRPAPSQQTTNTTAAEEL